MSRAAPKVERACADCGAVRLIHRYSKATICLTCSARRRGLKGGAAMRAKAKTGICDGCGIIIRNADGRRFCSVPCRSASKRVERVCKGCGASFTVYRSAISGRTNSAGNFCGRPCYRRWLCRTDRITGRGSQWTSARCLRLATTPFCVLCGDVDRLDVHHVVPFRLTRDNGQSNLFPLCKRHHKIVESITHDMEAVGVEPEIITLIIGSALLDSQRIIHHQYALLAQREGDS